MLVLFTGVLAEARYMGQYGPQDASQDLRDINRLLFHRARDERKLEPAQQRLLAKTEQLLDYKGHALAIEWIVSRPVSL